MTITRKKKKKKRKSEKKKNPSSPPQTHPKTSSSTTSQRSPSPLSDLHASPAGVSSRARKSPQRRSRDRADARDRKPQSAACGSGRIRAGRADSWRRGCRASGRCRAGGRRGRRGVCGGWTSRPGLRGRGRSGWDIGSCFLYFDHIYER